MTSKNKAILKFIYSDKATKFFRKLHLFSTLTFANCVIDALSEAPRSVQETRDKRIPLKTTCLHQNLMINPLSRYIYMQVVL